MLKLLGRFILTIFLLLILGGVVLYSKTIRTSIGMLSGASASQVAGAKTSLEKEVKEDITSSFESAKKKVLEVKLGDVVNGFSRAKKVTNDLEGVKNTVMEFIKDQSK